MQESEFIYEILANKALKGFIIKDGRVVPKMELTLEDNKAIDSMFSRVYGSSINKCLRDLDLNEWMEKKLSQIDIVDIVPGSIVKLELSHKEVIEIIYQGNYEFYLYHDSIGVLHPLDILKALSLSFEKGETVFFRVSRNGISFPDENMLFRGIVHSITLISTNIEGCQHSPEKNVEITTSLEKVFAWKADIHPARFVEENLTDSEQAIFLLDLAKKEFCINPYYSKQRYEDISRVLGPVCKLNYGDKGLQTIAPGKFSLEINKNKYSLYIRKKAEVGL